MAGPGAAAGRMSRSTAIKVTPVKYRSSPMGGPKRKDAVVSQRIFSRIRPEDRRALLTTEGAAERLRRLGRTQRASIGGAVWAQVRAPAQRCWYL